MGREHVERGTPTVHVAAWDPSSHGRDWDSHILKLDAHSSRIAPSSQRRRDGTFVPDRGEKLLSAYPHTTVKETKLAGHPQLLRDGSPREHPDKLPVWKWDHPTDYTTSQQMFFGRQIDGDSLSRPNRHMGAMPRRVSPNIYTTVFGRKPGEPADSPRAMPGQARVATRGAAFVPTLGHWADPPERAVGAPLSVPIKPDEEELYRMKLLEAQARSEQRMRMASIALLNDKLASSGNGGALTARF